ncbi:M23 family metallopeptidase [Clostridium thailandense]|uniref:M23 family metallopeptidase n=1 Tax=Clostridium thailandense TaxID=2794346 RepID=UPI0039899B36
MSLSDRAKKILIYISIIITIIVSGQYVYCNIFNAYQVYMDDKPLAYVKNKEDFYNVEKDIKKDLEKRFVKVTSQDVVDFRKALVNSKYISSKNELKSIILKNSKMSVSVVLMKSDGKKLGTLANENEMIKVLDTIKNEYKDKNKTEDLKLNNHITYVKEIANINDVNTIDEIVKKVKEDSNNSLVCFSKGQESNSVQSSNLSRASSKINLLQFPTKGNITSPFGMRWGKMHNGIDIGASMGDPIYAAMDGKVICAEWEDGYGKVIKIDHGVGIETVYGHCSSIDVNVGQTVKRGEKIGLVGSTGNSTGPHVHFEVRVEDVPKDPITYLR